MGTRKEHPLEDMEVSVSKGKVNLPPLLSMPELPTLQPVYTQSGAGGSARFIQVPGCPSWSFLKRLLLFRFWADPGNRSLWTHPLPQPGGVRWP